MEAFYNLPSTLYQGIGFILEDPVSALGISNVTAQTTSDLIINFFRDLFYNPNDHLIAIAVLAAVVIVLIVGAVYLIKKVWDRHLEQL